MDSEKNFRFRIKVMEAMNKQYPTPAGQPIKSFTLSFCSVISKIVNILIVGTLSLKLPYSKGIQFEKYIFARHQLKKRINHKQYRMIGRTVDVLDLNWLL